MDVRDDVTEDDSDVTENDEDVAVKERRKVRDIAKKFGSTKQSMVTKSASVKTKDKEGGSTRQVSGVPGQNTSPVSRMASLFGDCFPMAVFLVTPFFVVIIGWFLNQLWKMNKDGEEPTYFPEE